jgi:hypothetical protein
MLTVLDDVPARWSGGHVSRRLCEAFVTLRMMPIGMSKKSGSWPAYVWEWEDLLAQQEQGELERSQAIQNRTRILPSVREIARMELAIYWPAQFLASRIELSRAVNAIALAHSLERDAGWISAKHGGDPQDWRRNHDRGCSIIASGLRRANAPVF